MQPTGDAIIVRLAENYLTSTRKEGHGLWLEALGGVASELVRRAITHLEVPCFHDLKRFNHSSKVQQRTGNEQKALV